MYVSLRHIVRGTLQYQHHCLIICMSRDRAVVYTVDFYVSNPSSYHALATFLHLSFFMNIKEIYEFIRCTCNHFDLGGEKSYNRLFLNLIFYNNNETSNCSLYKITNHSYWHQCAYSCARYPREAQVLSELLVSVYLCF